MDEVLWVIRLPVWQVVTAYALGTLCLLGSGVLLLRHTAHRPFQLRKEEQ